MVMSELVLKLERVKEKLQELMQYEEIKDVIYKEIDILDNTIKAIKGYPFFISIEFFSEKPKVHLQTGVDLDFFISHSSFEVDSNISLKQLREKVGEEVKKRVDSIIANAIDLIKKIFEELVGEGEDP